MQSVRYQVFVSSTFTDLKEERAEVLQAIWELDCIPTGMEAFVATNESQWEVIKKVIDECDYYVLLIGGRYGSLAEDGISYTEKEYNYAKTLGIPVLAFVHGEPDSIALGKSESEEAARKKLNAFRSKIMSTHPIRKWTSVPELGGVVSRSLSREIKVNPSPGWIRNDGISNIDLIEQINSLTKENSALRADSDKFLKDTTFSDELESGDDVVTLKGIGTIRSIDSHTPPREDVKWSADASWDDIFKDLGPLLINESEEKQITGHLGRFIGWSEDIDWNKFSLATRSISAESFAEVMIQLRALGLIRSGIRRRAVSDSGRYWCLTPKGDQYLVSLLARKKIPSSKILPEDTDLA